MSLLINLTGQRFGFWLVGMRGENNSSGQAQWMCLCDCGTERYVTTNSLRSCNSTSCGCNHTPDLIGRIFGKLKVLSQDLSHEKADKRYWLCKCKCKRTIIVCTSSLQCDKITSCGICYIKKILQI